MHILANPIRISHINSVVQNLMKGINMYNRIQKLKQKYVILQSTKSLIEEQYKYGIIDFADATMQVSNLNKQERKLIKEAVDLIHVTRDGKPRKITYNESKGLYLTNTPDRGQVCGKTLDSLYDNLFAYYGLSIKKKKLSVGDVFNLAFERKKMNSTNKANSFKRNLNTYKSYFTDDFTKRDISKITKDDLLAYTKFVCQEFHPSKDEFLAYKGILNLIFEYAFDKDIRPDNPVPCIHNQDYFKDGYCNCITRESEDNIFSSEQIKEVQALIQERNNLGRFKGYDINGLAIDFSTRVGTRVGEVCALKWSDVDKYFIWIHAQLVEGERDNGEPMVWNYCPYTKDERKKSVKKGRYFPINNDLSHLLNYIKEKQIELGIFDENGFIFKRTDGSPINPNSYTKALNKLMGKLGFHVTNNHAFRKSLNSNVLIPMGLDEVQRASLLGHSPEVNLSNYTYKRLDDTDEIYQLFNNFTSEVKTRSRQNVVDFNNFKKEKVLRNQCF